jgi:recombination protein RecA
MALDIVDALVRSGALDVIAVDSVPALEPREPIDADSRASRSARQARLLSEGLRRLVAGIDQTRTVLVFGNRTRAARRDGVPTETAGGRALPFYASIRVELKRRELIREAGAVTGSWVKAITVKNKLAPPLRTATLKLVFGEGFIQ